MEATGSSVRVFDGTTDFRVWRARVENELMRYHLLGYVKVRDYNGTLHQMRLGDKDGEAVHEFITKWEMVMQQYAIVTGVELTDGFRSSMLVQTLPDAWRQTIASWRGIRPFVPYPELVQKMIAEQERLLTQVEAEKNQNNTTKALDKPKDRTPRSSVDSSVKKTMEKVTENSVEKPAGKSTDTTVDKPVAYQSAHKSGEKPTEKSPAEKLPTIQADKAEKAYRDEKAFKTTHASEKYDSYSKRDSHGQHNKYESPRHYERSQQGKYAYDKYGKSPHQDEYNRDRYKKSPAKYGAYDHYSHDNRKGPVSCFYCLKVGHHLKQCWYLKADIENGLTHAPNKKYSCTVTIDRNAWMVQTLEKYIDEENRARGTYVSQRSSRRERSYDDNDRGQQFVSPADPPIYAFHHESEPTTSYHKRSRSVFQSDENRNRTDPPRLQRSRSMYRGADDVKKAFNWVSEVEICFQEGRLGVSLREVHQMETILYAQFQAEVDDLPKINGKAGPAELHNWSVKPHKRLTIGMRVISIEDMSLAGLTYKEVVLKLKAASRPVRIKFADVAKGTVEENGGRTSDGNHGSDSTATDLAASGYGQSSAYMQQKQEYTRVLVTGELHTEMWTIENKKLLRSLTRMHHKWGTVSNEFDLLNARRMELRKESDVLKSDKDKYDLMMKHLKLQADFAMENPELVRANKLAKRNTELNEDISKMTSGNKRLRKERDTLQAKLDELEKQLVKNETSKDEEEDRVPEDDIFGIEPTAPPKEQLSALKKKRRGLEDELSKEQRKASKVQKEMEQLIKHYTSLGNEDSGASASSSPSHQSQTDDKDKSSLSSSGHEKDKSNGSSSGSSKTKSEFAELEAKILELRKKQRSVVDTLSKAAQSGDHKLAKDCQRRRQKIKEELKEAQDELHRLKTGGKPRPPPTASEKPHSRSGKTSTNGATPETTSQRSAKKSKTSGSANKDNLSSSTVDASADTSLGSSRGKMPMLSGFLEKGPTEWADRGLISGMKTMRGARERWCVITSDGFLKYYKRRGDSVVRGEINLAEKSFEVVCEDMKRGKEFVLSTDEQQSHFFTKSPQELNNWVKTLRAANAYLLNAAAPPLPPPRSTRGDVDKHALSRKDSKQAQEFSLDGLEDALPEEDEQFYGRATLGF
ncbi:hypothetical protein BBO99_00002581 [Phytophthora kernoviae]|uniref:PH domain-containing protein n=2 Tax=Phytophthora kernoviae TaxID=325452 RepID=A0A3R7HLE9_9STRA|nr:hypothetical protein G195_008721 [Phytophthora kernoviae 00238/432]KAG2517368.1 hypothetical protein JM16_007433 [Phytophthora kernoviae]KAG2530317.1 hypothetical protein JM18_002212 [Phytophthora kernoviae]RLN20940.1 hypothetical protein BBI17_002480 [Phytophthora kernoviae]RLN82880.1 hypothetical protein BBO99_00002581 [Phytophthora kernoviae]